MLASILVRLVLMHVASLGRMLQLWPLYNQGPWVRMAEPIGSRQWSTLTFAEGLSCVQENSPATLLAAAKDKDVMDDAVKLARMKARRSFGFCIWTPKVCIICTGLYIPPPHIIVYGERSVMHRLFL